MDVRGTEVLGIGLVLVGLLMFGGAWWAYSRRRAIADTPTSKVRSMAIGPVELHGTVVAAPGRTLVTSPFTNRECVYWEYEVEERRTRTVKGKSQTYWATVSQGRSREPIGLRDDTGTAFVDPQEGDLPAPDSDRFGSGFGRDPPDNVLSFLAAKGLSHEGLFGMNKTMRYTERRLHEGATLYVLGNAVRREGAAGSGSDALAVQRDGDGVWLVSTSSEKQLLRQWTASFVALLLGGITFAAVGAWMIAVRP